MGVIDSRLNTPSSYTPTSGFGTGVPVGSIRVIYPAQYQQIGKTIMVRGFAYFRNDGSAPNFDWTLPVTNGNVPTNVTGTMIRTPSTGETSTTASRLNASTNSSTAITWSNSGITINASDAVWAYEFQYTLT